MAVPLQELRDAQDSGPGAQAVRQPPAPARSPAPGSVPVCLSVLPFQHQKRLHRFPQHARFHRSSAMFKLNLP